MKVSQWWCFRVYLMCLQLLVGSVFSADLGPVSRVSKHLWFPNFSAKHRANHEIRLLGNAGLVESSGIIEIPATSSNTHNQNLSFQAGKALYSSPVRMLDPVTGTPASFHTTFTFQIKKNSLSSNDSVLDDGSSGLTFAVVPDELTVGRSGGWLGMLNDACDETYKAFALEFDTFRNAEFGDPNDNHVGINLGSIVSNTTLDAAEAGVSLKSGSTVRAWINYDGDRRWMEVKLANDRDPIPKKALYSAELDLSSFLNEYMFVGFSASTGHAAQLHNILSWNFSTTSSAHLRLPSEMTCEVNLLKGSKDAQKEPPGAFLIFVGSATLFLAVLVYVLWNKKAHKQTKSIISKVALTKSKVRPRPPNKSRRFGVSEISMATRCFSDAEVLGNGDKGTFYKGALQNGVLVAIKRFSKEFLQRNDVDKNRILREVKLLCRLKHPNLVPLKGWCNDKGELMMVYEYMQNGSLDKWLFARGVLPWPRRYKVIKDVAEAMEFLHKGWERGLVHKNIKTSNVLLDITFRARLGDFGLANCANSDTQEQNPLKLQNHFPPETMYVLQPTEKMDVYNFGIMVLEIISGRRSVDTDLGPEEADLVEYTWSLHEKEELTQLADQRLQTRYNPEQVKCLASVALLCTHMDPKARPTMTEVIQYINGDQTLPPLPPFRPVALYIYPSAPQLCMKTCSPASLHLLGYKSGK